MNNKEMTKADSTLDNDILLNANDTLLKACDKCSIPKKLKKKETRSLIK